MDVATLVIVGVLDIFSIFIIGKELVNFRDFKYTFTCEHCGKHIPIISDGAKCDKCHRRIKDINKQWDHYLSFRVSGINTRGNRDSYEYKKCIIPFRIELTVDIFCFVVLSIVLLNLFMGVHQ